ncbi:hypothetical protein ACLHDG_05145 [Sulfurovum sp. CS9]|uniref:hypothetical protein n=1 Tax=Sulfurovum sp. CS9 TaxID=3391146 RepID=UPI0039E76726
MKTVRAILPLLLFIILCFPAASVNASETLKRRTLDALSSFISQYENTAFGQVISLGDMNKFRMAFAQDLDVELNPDLGMSGKYYPSEARWGIWRNHLLELKSTDLRNDRVMITIYHESIHHLIYLAGGAPCGPEETYTELIEDRIAWLKRVAAFERYYERERPSSTEAFKRWNDLEKKWKHFVDFRAGSLSGPYAWQDPEGSTCEDPDRIYTIGPGFISKLDEIVGIDIDIRKIRAVYEGIWTGNDCLPGQHEYGGCQPRPQSGKQKKRGIECWHVRSKTHAGTTCICKDLLTGRILTGNSAQRHCK